jgi:outer membrane protein assembly factor BamA
MKSSSADYLYTMPRVLGTEASLFFNASGLRREEIDFVRQEAGGGVGVQRFFTSIASDVGLRYNYEYLNAAETTVLQEEEGLQTARVASFVLDIKHDQRDNPLIPRKGYKVFSNMEFASASLGGEVDYQRLETGASFHFQIGRGRYLHLGARHGAGLTLNGEREELPFNKRFFPGGENSVRGYQQGEAGPRNEEGRLIGAATFLQGNIELEQMLTPSWSLVVFLDGVGFARNIEDYPFDQELFSVGGGIRWKTIIGPARLEYGYNLNPREQDPSGTLHFSIGFPF